MKRLTGIFAVFMGMWVIQFPSMGWAEQIPSNISELVQVQSNCKVVGGIKMLAFGNYDPSMSNLTKDLDGTSDFSIRCTPGTSAVISMDDGKHPQGSTRRMLNNLGSYLEYQLYTDAGRSTVWNLRNTKTYASNSLLANTFTVYGRVPAGQENALAGSYTDEVTVTISF